MSGNSPLELISLEDYEVDFLPKDPYLIFKNWLKNAEDRNMKNPNAMVISTIGFNDYPDSRYVLLRKFDERGFIFYTNYNSSKGIQINRNNKVSCLFYWRELARQVRVQGNVEKLSYDESEKYFHSRARGSQIGAWSSKQSRVIPSRDYLEKYFKMYENKFKGKEVDYPEFWGGFLVKPIRIEYWQSRENRLHDRFCYNYVNNIWACERLSP